MSCSTGKVEHQTVTAAQAHADSIFKKDGHQPNVYICSECGFFHVGGGRASDRPVYRGKQIITTAKPVFVQKKIDDGKHLELNAVILDKLRTTFVKDTDLAKQLCCDLWRVEWLRKKNKIPNSHHRQRNAVRKLLEAKPDRNRGEIAKVLRVSEWYVKAVVKEMGLEGTAKSGRRGFKHQNFGKRLSKELRAKISERTREAENTTEWRARASARTQIQNNLPKTHKGLSDAANKRWRRVRERLSSRGVRHEGQ